MKKLILMVLIFIELALCTMPILAVNLSGKSSNVKLNNNIKVDLKEIGELTNFTPETLDSFKYKINEYEAIVIVDSAKVNNSKDEFFTTLNLGQVVQVYGIYNNDTNRVVIGWENGFGTVNQKDLNDITGVKLDTLEDLDYIGDTYKAKIGIYGALLKNSKAQEIIYIPTEKVIDVYGFWAEDNSKLVVKYNGLYGIIPANSDHEEINTRQKNVKNPSTESFYHPIIVTRTDYDAVVVGKSLPLLNDAKEEIDIVPDGSQVHVYGKWRRNRRLVIIKWNGVYGSVETEYLKTKEKLENFKYSGSEYDAVIIEEDISILNSKKEKLDNVEYGENVHVYGILENDSNYAVVGWNDLFGLIEIKALDKIEINYSVNDFKYSKEEYDAEVVDFPLAFRNNKGYLVGEVPIGTIVHVYGIWEKDEERAVISWEGMIGTVIVRRLKKVIVNETLDNFEYTKNEYDAQVVNYDLAFRDNNNNLIEEIPIGEKVHVYGIYKKNPERAVISWKNQYGTVLVKHLYSIINSKAENFMYSGTSYWAVVFSHDFLYLWDANDKYFADVPANSLIWVYGEYDKDLKQPRTVINWNGKIGTVRSEFLIKIDDAVHVDIKKQKVTMFENGEPLYYGDCVTGREEGENPTPTRVGQFKILEMNEDDVPLKGEDYEVFVDYWMGFDGGIGLHDSTRTAFGGNIYLKNGSHGCVNLPKWLAEKIYRRAYVDMSVHVSR